MDKNPQVEDGEYCLSTGFIIVEVCTIMHMQICSRIWPIMRLFVVPDNKRSVITMSAAARDGSKT